MKSLDKENLNKKIQKQGKDVNKVQGINVNNVNKCVNSVIGSRGVNRNQALMTICFVT